MDKFSRTRKNSYLVDGQLGASDFKISTEVRKIPVYTSDSLVDINYEVSSMDFFRWGIILSPFFYVSTFACVQHFVEQVAQHSVDDC